MGNINHNQEQTKNSYWGIISISPSIVLTIFILNFFLKIVPLPNVQGLPIILSPIIAFPGIIIGYIGFRKTKDKLALWGAIYNTILFIFPFAFNIIATILCGP